jgi:hypothetical protein
MVKLVTLTLALPAGLAVSPWAVLAIYALWSLWWLPDWVDKWLDVRDRWQGPRP